jgi:hypothetical protein
MTAVRDHHAAIKSAAEKVYATNPDWITFYREILGLRGMIRRYCPTMPALAQFEQTEAYREIQRMLADLRKRRPIKKDPEQEDVLEALGEETKVITVRIPQSLHDALRIEAFEHRTSMNKLCISKLLQFIDTEHVPAVFEDQKAEADPKKAEAGL